MGTPTLYLVDGERVTPRSLRLAVADLDRRFVEEDRRGLMPQGFERDSAWPQGDEVWLWVALDGREVGFAAFCQSPRGYALTRVWIAPEYRRQGLLGEAWLEWQDRYGEFEVAEPNVAMQAFMREREQEVEDELARRRAGP